MQAGLCWARLHPPVQINLNLQGPPEMAGFFSPVHHVAKWGLMPGPCGMQATDTRTETVDAKASGNKARAAPDSAVMADDRIPGAAGLLGRAVIVGMQHNSKAGWNFVCNNGARY